MPWQNNIFPLIIITSGPGFTGLFIYSPAPGPNNLIASITGHSGTDPFGNTFLSGITVYALFGGFYFALNMSSSQLNWYIGGATESVPYVLQWGLSQGALVSGTTKPNLNINGPHFGGIEIASTDIFIPPSGDTTGVKDTAALNAAFLLGTNITARLLPGQWYINATINLSTAGTAIGGGIGATVVNIVSPFTGTSLFNVTGTGTVQDMTIQASSATVTLNPAVTAIELTGTTAARVFNVQFTNINGWCVESVPSGALFGAGSVFSWLYGFNCAGGVHLKSNTTASFNGQMFLGDSTFQQIGVSSGTFANLDALFIEDCSDILVASINTSASGTGTGSSIHVKGHSAGIGIVNPDCGVFPGTGVAPTMLIEDSASGSPTGLSCYGGILQRGSTGLTITGGANLCTFEGVHFFANQTHGLSVTGTGFGLRFDACMWNFNNQANGTAYEVNWTNTAQGTLRDCGFYSGVGAGVGLVTHVGNCTSFTCVWEHNDLLGTGTTVANAFAAGGKPLIARSNQGYNPVGTLVVGVPASGTAIASQLVDATFWVTAAAGGATTITMLAGPAVVVAASTTQNFFLPANQTFTPTYGAGNAPTWVVYGQ